MLRTHNINCHAVLAPNFAYIHFTSFPTLNNTVRHSKNQISYRLELIQLFI